MSTHNSTSLFAHILVPFLALVGACGGRTSFSSSTGDADDSSSDAGNADAAADGDGGSGTGTDGADGDGKAGSDDGKGGKGGKVDHDTDGDGKADGDGKGDDDADDDGDGSLSGDDPKVDLETLTKLCASTAVKEFTQKITFPKPTTPCDWGKDDNLPFDANNQLIITARREQAAALSLPSKAHFCDMTFDFPSQRMRYDDEIMLLFDGLVLAGSQGYDQPGEMETKDGFLIYDWSKIKGDAYPIFTRSEYFIDQDCADCKIPETEQTGTMKLTIKPKTVRRLSVAAGIAMNGKTAATAKHAFGFVTTGDNDAQIDCAHEDFEFTVHGTYATP